MQASFWKIWIDTGGTFTDCLSVTPEGMLRRLKVLSSSLLRVRIIEQTGASSFRLQFPYSFQKDFLQGFTFSIDGKHSLITGIDLDSNEVFVDKPYKNTNPSVAEITSHEEVPVFAARILTETGLSEAFPAIELKLGSTRGTNALLERKGARTALLVTKGFKDLLLIGNQQRPDLFSLNIIKELPLYDVVLEVDERIEADGNVLKALSHKEAEGLGKALYAKKIETVAVALINSYRNPVHEVILAEALQTSGVRYISCSHVLSGQIKILPRAETSIVNAYLKPIIDTYVQRIHRGLSAIRFFIISSAGGLLPALHFHPKDSLLSGPAGGVIGGLRKAQQSGIDKIITFDMGGTSTDVSLCNGRPDYRFECSVGSLRILSPSLAIETIAAGGGSICSFDGFRFIVGPHSAGASPGPACYGAGGPLTITDVNLLLGRLDEDNFFIPIFYEHAQQRLNDLLLTVRKHTKKQITADEALQAFIAIANEKMAEAIRKVSVQRGHDLTEYTILCFGGAGGQHTCALASMLNVNQVLVPYDAGLLSAYGIGHADIERIKEKLLLTLLEDTDFLRDSVEDLFNKAKQELVAEGFHEENIYLKNQLLFLRLKGQETSLEIEYDAEVDVKKKFISQYKAIYGHWVNGRSIEIESVRVVVAVKESGVDNGGGKAKTYHPEAYKQKKIFTGRQWKNCRAYRWELLQPGALLQGPALVISDNSTLFIEKDWTFALDVHQNALLKKISKTKESRALAEEAKLELYTNRFTAIAQDMGVLLQRTSFSVNVKERLDFSCALLDATGNLIVNAPHIPVHLGSLGVCVRALLKAIPVEEGDIIITNHPAYGGSHLPDITLVKPVYYKKKRIGFVANRAHHAEIGGKKPGSMPADATCLEEEGVAIAPAYLARKGIMQWGNIEATLLQAVYPTRSLHENIADLNGALAALIHGEEALIQLCKKYTTEEVESYMQRLYRHAATLMQNKIKTLSQRSLKAVEYLDNGAALKVTITPRKGKLLIDFTGSDKVQQGNMNATTAIVNSVVLYVLRLLIDQPIPLNEGLLDHVRLIIPTGILNPKFYTDNKKSPAVVGGNTEVSQRLTDTLLKAFGLMACSQGTMNNFLFGNERFGYYETICGGTGAGPGFNGASAVHHHMTNTRITDTEIMEHRYPVRVEQFAIRTGSGGKGKWHGGNGIIRELFFKEALEINILSQHRIEEPYGVKGGDNGKAGEQYLVRKEGKKEKLKGITGTNAQPGDRIIIKTPGGGGWGKKQENS